MPAEMAERFLELGAQGNELAILQFAADEKISEIAEEAVSHAFYWSQPRANGQFFEFVRGHDDGRMWTFALLDSLWQQYNVSTSVDRLAQEPSPTPEDFDKMSDSEIDNLLTKTQQLRLKNQIRQKV